MHKLHHRAGWNLSITQLTESRFELRPAEISDEPFLFALYAQTHGRQFALLPLPSEALDALMRMQFNAQRVSYRQRYPASQEFVIVASGQSAGRLWLDESKDSVRILDIALLPEQQGRGMGSHLLQSVIGRAEEAGKSVCLSVPRSNERALGLYRRLGFAVSGQNEVYVEMCRAADSAGQGDP